MTNRLAFWLLALLAIAAICDLVLTGGAALLFAAQRLAHLIDWLAFWR